MQLALFPAPPAPLQLALELPAVGMPISTTTTPKGPTMTTTPHRRRGPLRRWLDRRQIRREVSRVTERRLGAGRLWLLPSTTEDLTPDDWRVIRLALQRAIVEHTAADRWPAAEAAQHTLDKLPKP